MSEWKDLNELKHFISISISSWCLSKTSKRQIFIAWVNQFCLKIKVYPVTYLQAYWTISCEGWGRVLVMRFGRFWCSGGWIYLLLWVETIIRSCKINAPIPLLNNEWEREFCEIEYFSHHSKWSQRFKSRGILIQSGLMDSHELGDL